jgi:hypothetical protein
MIYGNDCLTTCETLKPRVLCISCRFGLNASTDYHRVIYFNLGGHHVPHSGDIPNTLMHTSASSVMFTPFNFHDRDPSRKSAQGVKLEKGAGGATPKYFGSTYKGDFDVKLVSTSCCIQFLKRDS